MHVDIELFVSCRSLLCITRTVPAGMKWGTKVSDEENRLEAFFFDVWKSLKGLSSLKALCLPFFFLFFSPPHLIGETFIDVLLFL